MRAKLRSHLHHHVLGTGAATARGLGCIGSADISHKPNRHRIRCAMRFPVLFLAGLLVVASSACTATTGTETHPPTVTTTSIHAPETTLAVPSTPESASPESTSPASVVDIVASRTPEPTLAPSATGRGDIRDHGRCGRGRQVDPGLKHR